LDDRIVKNCAAIAHWNAAKGEEHRMTVEVTYTAECIATGAGRTGHVTSADGTIDFDVRPPTDDVDGAVNPETLFGAGYAACFLGALRKAARSHNVELDHATAITALIGFGRHSEGGFGLTATLRGTLPGIDRFTADMLMSAAHETCPYSKATRGNVAVVLEVAV
jgi:osmotically inducible protein OsmC